MISNQLLGMTSAATAVRTHPHILTNISIAMALLYGFLNLLFGNGFAHANVHTKHPQVRINIVDELNVSLMRRICKCDFIRICHKSIEGDAKV